jgi:hypothetical protein
VKRSPRRLALAAIHLATSMSALLLLATFWLSTAYAELVLDAAGVAAVKRAIVGGIALLVPALIVTGATGRLLAGPRAVGLAAKKLARTKLAAANGVLVLVPSALALAHLAETAPLGALFYGIQALELAAGAVNLVLFGRNARDGLVLAGHLRPRRAVRPVGD